MDSRDTGIQRDNRSLSKQRLDESEGKREGREPESHSLCPQLPLNMEMRRVLSSQRVGIKKMESPLSLGSAYWQVVWKAAGHSVPRRT